MLAFFIPEKPSEVSLKEPEKLIKRLCVQLTHMHWGSMNCSPPASSVNGISQARILEWVTISFSREFSQPRYQSHVSCIGSQILYHWITQRAFTNGIFHKTRTKNLKICMETQKTELVQSDSLTSDYTTKWQSSKQYGIVTELSSICCYSLAK